MTIEVLKIIIPPFLYVAFGFLVATWLYRNKSTRKLKIITKLFSIESEKFREIIKNDYNITKLELVDSTGKKKNPYPLKEGENKFYCVATYTDGTKAKYNPYWLCWEKGVRDGWNVFGRRKRERVTVHRNPKHVRYTELSCWIFPPKKEESNAHIPFDSIGFKYPANYGE